MPTITLNLAPSLEMDSNGKLKVKVSQKANNNLTVEPDGLYAEAIPGQPGSSGTGFPDKYRSYQAGITSGVTGPDDTTSYPRRIVAPSITHRIFTCNNNDGSDVPVRSMDYIYPGDMYRVLDTENGVWKYYVIVSVSADGKTVSGHSNVVASIPVSEVNIN